MLVAPTKHFIDGQFVDSLAGGIQQVYNPATQQLITKTAWGDVADAEKAVQAAHQAFVAWAAQSAYTRGAIMRRWFELMLEHKEALAEIMTAESGKPLAESRAEIDYAAAFVDWFAEEGKRAYGRTVPSAQGDSRVIMVVPRPLGVVAAITPWNFPSAMITRKAAAAMAAGCTLVVKPDHRTPLSALALAELAQQAGVPAGVFNVVLGDAATLGEFFCNHPLIQKITFTGSTRVGKILMQQCSASLKKLSLELGGNAPFIVFDDATVSQAVDGLMAAKIRNAGQTCICPNRIFAHEHIYDTFLSQLTAKVSALKVGNGQQSDVQVGPLIDATAVARIDGLVQQAIKQGAVLAAGGQALSALGPYFYAPTILSDITAEMDIYQAEIFGPVFSLIKFSDEADVLAQANSTPYGLAAYVFTQNLARSQRAAASMRFGMVGVNSALISFAAAPFGGMKESGLMREGGLEGLQAYQEIQYIALADLSA